MEEPSYTWELLDGESIQMNNPLQQSADVANEAVSEIDEDKSSDGDEDFVVLTDPSDSENSVRNSQTPEGDNKAQECSSLDKIKDATADVAAGVETDAASQEGSFHGDQPEGLHRMRAGLHDVLLNDEAINEDNGNIPVVEAVGDEHFENGDHLNIVENLEAVAHVDADEEDIPVHHFPQQQLLRRGLTFVAAGLVIALLCILYKYKYGMPDTAISPKQASQSWDPLTQCPKVYNPSLFIDHAIGTDGPWKSEHDARFDALEARIKQLEEEVAAAHRAAAEYQKGLEWQRGRAEMWFALYTKLKTQCEATCNCNPDWLVWWKNFARAAQDQVSSVPEVARRFEETVQEGLKTLKSLGLNVTEGLQSAFMTFARSFNSHSDRDKEGKPTKNQKSNNPKRRERQKSRDQKSTSFDQSKGTIPRNMASEIKTNRKCPYMFNGHCIHQGKRVKASYVRAKVTRARQKLSKMWKKASYYVSS